MNKTYIIAEIGVNHNGNLKNAKKLISLSKKIGADCVKFQAFNASELASKDCNLANYQKKTKFKNQLEMLKKYELKENEIFTLYKFAKKKKIEFLLSIFDEISFSIDRKIKTKFIKIPSGEITNFPLLKLCSKSKKNVILSTGASTIKEISKALKIIKKKNVILLHCNSAYPTPISDSNIRNILTLKKVFKKKVGLSDHSKSTIIPAVAVGLGADYVEKHITLNNDMVGPDHSASLNLKNFEKMIKNVRIAEKSLGSLNRYITNSEKKNRKIIRKYIVARKIIKKGERFTVSNLASKRSKGGISSIHWKKFLKKRATKNYNIDEKI